MAGTVLPNQMLMAFRQHAGGVSALGPADEPPEPRLVLGRENLLLQGFPIDIIEGMQGNFKESFLTDLAGNMVSTPVLLAMFLSAMASASWIPACDVDDGRTDVMDGKLLEEKDDISINAKDGKQPPLAPAGAGETEHVNVDGLMEGPKSLPDEGGKGIGTKRRGGLFQCVYKVPKME